MSINKKLLKKRNATSYEHACGSLAFLIRGNDFNSMINLELHKTRILKKMRKYMAYENSEPFYANSWSVPILITNPSKRSRIKNFCTGYEMLKCSDIIKPNGVPFTDDELMNQYCAKAINDE